MLNRKAPANPITDDRDDDVHDKVEEIAVDNLAVGKVKAAKKGLESRILSNLLRSLFSRYLRVSVRKFSCDSFLC